MRCCVKKRWSILSSLVLVSSLFASDGTAVFAQSYVVNGNQVGTAGTLGYYDGQVTILGSNGQPYQNGNNNTPFKLYSSTTTGLNTLQFDHAVFEYAPESVSLSGVNSGSGYLWHVDEVANNLVPVTSDNGYLMISNTERSAWVNALNGNLAYVDQAESSSSIADGEEYDAEFQDRTTNEMFPLYDFPAIVLDSGDELVSGSNDLGPVDVIVTPKPTASISASNPIIGQGHTETLTGTGTVSAYDTDYHYAGVSITNVATGASVPQSDITFAGNDGEAPIQTPSGGTMYEMNTGDSSYSDTINVNTQDLTAGTYSVTYDVSDYRDRFAPATTTTFTVRAPASGALTLTANPTSTTVGTDVTLSASYSGAMPSNSAIYLHDMSNDNTLQGSNQAEGTIGQSTFTDSNVVANTTETVEYDAVVEVNGEYISSSPVYVTWNAPTASCAEPASLTAGTPSGTTDTINVSDPSGNALALSVNHGGTLSQTIVTGSTTVTLTGQAGTTYTVSATDETNSDCATATTNVTFASATPTNACGNYDLTAGTTDPQTGVNQGTIIYVSGLQQGETVTLTASGSAVFNNGLSTDTMTVGRHGEVSTGIQDQTAETVDISVNGSSDCLTLNFESGSSTNPTCPPNGCVENPNDAGFFTFGGTVSGPNYETTITVPVNTSVPIFLAPGISENGATSVYTNPLMQSSMATFPVGWTLSASGGSGTALLEMPNQAQTLAGAESIVDSSVPQTDTYTAVLNSPSGQTYTAQLTIHFVGLTVSANPTTLAVNNASTITITGYSDGNDVELYASAPNVLPNSVAVYGTSGGHGMSVLEGYVVNLGTLDGSTTLQATSTNVQTVTFKAESNYDNAVGIVALTSNVQAVEWIGQVQACTLPPSLTGGTATGDTYAVGVTGEAGDTVTLTVTDGTFANGQTTTQTTIPADGQTSVTIDQSAGATTSTVTVTGDTDDCATGETATINWATTIACPIPPHFSASVYTTTDNNETVTIDGNAGDTVGVSIDVGGGTIVGGTYGSQLTAITLDSQGQGTLTVEKGTNSTGNLELTYDSNSQCATGETATIDWGQPTSAPTVTLSASPTSLAVNDPSILQVTSTGFQNGDYLHLMDDDYDNTLLNGSAQTEDSQTSTLSTTAVANVPETVSYTAVLYNASNQVLATSNTVSVTWLQGQQSVDVTLTANPTSVQVGQSSTLTATIASGYTDNDTQWLKIFDETTDRYLGGSFSGSVTAQVTEQSAQTDTFIAYVTTYQAGAVYVNNAYQSNTASVTWTAPLLSSCQNGSIPQKPIEQVLEQSTSCTSQGYDKLTWVDTNWVLQATTHTGVKGVCTGDYTTYQWVDEPVTYDHIYVDNLQNLEISGLLMDPGVPGDPWSDVNQTATQVNRWVTVDDTITGQQLPTYTNPYAGVNGAPYVYVRPAGGFGFRILWTGSPFDVMQSMDVTFVMKNPDGTTRTWTETPTTKYPTNLDTATLDRVDIINPYDGANGYAPYAGQYASAYTPIPKYVNRLDGQQHLELAAWNMTGDASTAATITATITVNTNCGSVITTIPNIAQLFNDPTWYFIHQVPNSSVPQTGITWVKLNNDPTDGESMPTTSGFLSPAEVNAQDATFMNANPELKGP